MVPFLLPAVLQKKSVILENIHSCCSGGSLSCITGCSSLVCIREVAACTEETRAAHLCGLCCRFAKSEGGSGPKVRLGTTFCTGRKPEVTDAETPEGMGLPGFVFEFLKIFSFF